MDNEHLIDLFNGYLNAAISGAERDELFEYIGNPENAGQVKNVLGDAINNEPGNTDLHPQKQSIILQKIFDAGQAKVNPAKTRTLVWLRVAATIAFIVSASIFLINRKQNKAIHLAYSVNHVVIRPGGNKAILTLSSGKQIVLNDQSNGTISKQGNASVVKLAGGELAYSAEGATPAATVYNTMSTPRGGKYDLILADGTKVWLNAASSITYPTAFNGTDRTVSITGEAYFEVAHNKDKPFRVQAQGQTVEVLGTHFNVNAYADEAVIKTTLLEGKVKISKGADMALLTPGKQAVIQKNRSGILVKDADTEETVAWKNGLTSFKNSDIKEIMRQISRWYDVDVDYKAEISEQRLFTGEISRKAELPEVLKVLQLSDIHFTINGKRIMVAP